MFYLMSDIVKCVHNEEFLVKTLLLIYCVTPNDHLGSKKTFEAFGIDGRSRVNFFIGRQP